MEERVERQFVPARVIFTNEALAYPLGKKLWETFSGLGIPVIRTARQDVASLIPGATAREIYQEAKRTLAVGVRRGTRFETCRPSADYQLPLVASCPGSCQYCYLHTRFGRHPYLRAYVNIEEILARADRYIAERHPAITSFEAAASGDPLPLEPYTGALKTAIEHFASQDKSRLRFVTKYVNVGSLLAARHAGRTRTRLSVNLPGVIRKWEGGAPRLEERLEAVHALAKAGYPVGFLIAPVFLFADWQKAYGELLDRLAGEWRSWELPEETTVGEAGEKEPSLTLEIVSHRFTARAREAIREIFPQTSVPFEQECRSFRYGQFGYGKYVYNRELLNEMKAFFSEQIARKLPRARLEYIV